MSRISVIALEQLPPMQVLETLDVEEILAARMDRLVELWKENDPPQGAVYDVEGLEFDPIKINQEVSTYFELMVRDRVNQAARAVTLAFAVGGDLDAIASRYPGGVPRLAVVDDPRTYEEHPEDWESDSRYRRRIWLSPNLESPHGVFEAYVFWALTADASLHDATATSVRGTGEVTVTIMAGGEDPTPTSAQLASVLAYVEDDARKGLTDAVQVRPPTITETRYHVRVWLYPGYEREATMADLEASVAALIEKQRWLGFDHTLMALNGAVAISGVWNAVIDEPAEDVLVEENGLVEVTEVVLTFEGRGE